MTDAPDLEPAALRAAIKDFQERTGGFGADDDYTAIEGAVRAYLAARSAPEAGKAVTDAMVKRATQEFLSHRGERPERIKRGGYELWEENAPAMRAALTAALASSPAPTGAEPAWGPAVRAATRESHASIYDIGAPQPVAPTGGKFIAEWRTQAEIEAGVQLDGRSETDETGLTERLRGPAFGTPTALQAADIIDKLQADVEMWKTRAERLADMHRDMCVIAGETDGRLTASEAEAADLRRKLEERDKRIAKIEADLAFADEQSAKVEALLEPHVQWECASEGCGKPATVHFVRGDVGSWYCRDCYMRTQAIPATRQALESDNG